MSLAAKLPFRHRHAAGFPGLGSQPVPTDADALDYLDRMAAADGASVEVGVAVAVDAFIKEAKSSGVWDSIRASCILAGARTLAGALVPLKNEGPELWDGTATPSLIINGPAGCGAYDASTHTLANECYNESVVTPRFYFQIGTTAGITYRITGRLSGDTSHITSVRLGVGSLATYNPATGEISGTLSAADADLIFYLNGTLAPTSVTIESLSIREVIDAPTNVANGFVSGDYTRGGATPGLKGDGTSYLDSGRAPSDDPLNDAHISVYVTASATSNTHYKAGAYSAATQQTLLRSNFGTFISAVNSGNFASSGGGNDVGMFGASRFASDSSEFRLLGVTTPDSTASDAQSTQNVTVFARNDGTPDGFFDGTIAFYSIGTSVDLEALDTAVNNLLTAMKFHFNTGLNPSEFDVSTQGYINLGYANGSTLE